MMTRLLEDKVVWITGASRGIGRSIALACAAEGAHTVLVARERSHLSGTAAAIEEIGNGSPPTLLEYDITDPQAVSNALINFFKTRKRLDAMINNAGIMDDAPLGMITQDLVERVFSVNVYATLYHMQFASRLMARAKAGSIVNISSILGRVGGGGQAVYSAGKAAVIGATLAASKELAQHNIRVNAVAPGFIDTDMTRKLPEERRQKVINNIGFRRPGTPEEVAQTVLFLASDRSAYLTGQIIGVDGGMLI
jgi:3-oxoacyl-[acyl-carrier protein] reductase